MKKALLIFTLIFLGNCIYSWSQNACFKVDNTIGCTPFTVNITSCANTNKIIIYKYEDGVGYKNITQYTYTKAGKYSITQKFVNKAENGWDSLTINNLITVIDSKAPKFEYYYCTSNRVKIMIKDTTSQFFSYYILTHNNQVDTLNKVDSAIVNFQGVNNPSFNIRGVVLPTMCGSDTTINLNNLIQNQAKTIFDSIQDRGNQISVNFASDVEVPYFLYINDSINSKLVSTKNYNSLLINKTLGLSNNSFQLSFYDACDIKEYKGEKIYLRKIESKALQNLNEIKFEKINPIENYTSNNLIKNSKTNISLTDFQDTYIDSSVNCLQNYCYSFQSKYPSGAIATSNSTCVTAISTKQPKIEKILATVENDKILYVAYPSPESRVKYFHWYDINNSQISNSHIETTVNQLQKDFNGVKCVALQLVDSCENKSDLSDKICNISLSGTENQSNFNLDYNAYVSPYHNQNINYIIELSDSKGITYKELQNNNQLSYFYSEVDTVSAVTHFTIKAIVGSDTVFSNTISRNNGGKIFFPNAFTPNGDGVNEVFLPKGRFISSYQLLIFDRESRLVFKSTDFDQGWDGTGFPRGDYIYEFEATDLLGKKFQNRGIVTLIR